MMNSSTVN